MAIDFEAIKKLPVDEQVTEYKKVVATLDKKKADSQAEVAKLEKEEKSDERDKKLAELKKTLDECAKDRLSAEQLLARSEIESKELENVLRDTRAKRAEDDEKQLVQRTELENIVQAERKRDESQLKEAKRQEHGYEAKKAYDVQSAYGESNTFYATVGPVKPQSHEAYKSKDERQREQEVIRGAMYDNNSGNNGYR